MIIDDQKAHELALIIVEKCTGIGGGSDFKATIDRAIKVYIQSIVAIQEAAKNETT